MIRLNQTRSCSLFLSQVVVFLVKREYNKLQERREIFLEKTILKFRFLKTERSFAKFKTPYTLFKVYLELRTTIY